MLNQIKRQMIWIGLMAIVFVGLAANAAIQNTGPAYGQETGTATTTPTAAVPSPTGKLVVAPTPLLVGQTAEAVGFHVEPVDQQVRIEYSEHFGPDGESCDGSSTTTPSAVAPTWITLKACSAGNGYVRLIASDTGHVIEEVSVTITDPTKSIIGQGGGGGVAGPRVWLTGVASTLKVGSSDGFRVHVSGLNRTKNYKLYTVSLNRRSLAFNSSCDDFDAREETIRGVINYSTSYTVHGCSSPGTYLWSYLSGDATDSSGLRDHYVTVPAPPSVDISGLVSSMEEGDSDRFTVSASDLDSSARYTIRVTTDSSSSDPDIGFNSTCSDRSEQVNVPSRRTAYSRSFTLHGCEADGGTVTATLRSGNADVDSDSHDVEVTPPPSIDISGLASSMEEGDSDRFTVSASDLDSSASYTIEVTTSDSDIGFNSTCSITSEEVNVPSRGTSYSRNFTLYGCDETKASTVTATLRSGNADVDSDTQDVKVTAAPAPVANRAPSFSESSYSFSIREDASSGTTVGSVSATDPDRDAVSYSIIGGNTAGRFTIHSSNGRITTAKTLDHEVSTDYELTVKAAESRDSSTYDLGVVRISVTDVNESPRFGLGSYQFAIRAQPGISLQADDLLVGGIRALDPDISDTVTYSITSGDSGRKFHIDGLGRIWARPAARSSVADFTLTVEASDGNRISADASTKVKVKVTSLSIAKLKVYYDRVAQVEQGTQLRTAIEFDYPTTAANSQFTMKIAEAEDSTLRSSGVLGASATNRPTSFLFGNITVRPRYYTNGREYDFDIIGSRTSVRSDLPIPYDAVPTGLRTGESYLSLALRSGSRSQFALSNDKVPIVIYDSEIEVGESFIGEWGFIPSNTRQSEPNERQFSLTIPDKDDGDRFQIDLTSGGRDPILMLQDSRGDLLEWNDDGGAGTNAKIVRELDSGSYTVVAFTQWSGSPGVFELIVSESEEPLTDPDGEYADLTESGFYVPRADTSTSDLVPDGASISGLTWKSTDTGGRCNRTVTSVAQGDLVCLEVTGSGFQSGDGLLAILLVEADDQYGPVAIGAVSLGYESATKMRGKWVAQRLSEYQNSSGKTSYRVVVTGDDSNHTASLSVGSRGIRGASSISGASAGSAASQLESLLVKLGLSDSAQEAREVVSTLLLIFGEEGQTSEAFARDFLDGALLGEFGDNDTRSLAFYAGWMIIGFIPGVDILPDLRDAFALEITKCSGWGWNSWKCRGTAAISDAVDFVAVVPVWGKVADVVQTGKIAYRYRKGLRGQSVLENSRTIVRRFLEGRRGCWVLEPWGTWGRGICIQDELLKVHEPGTIDLDKIKRGGSMPVVDFVVRIGNKLRVTSVKSLDVRSKSYVENPGKVGDRLGTFYKDLKDHSDVELGMNLRNKAEKDETLTMFLNNSEGMPSRQLDFVISEDIPVNMQQGRGLQRKLCRILYGTLGDPNVSVRVMVGNSNAGGFRQWSGHFVMGEMLTRSHCNAILAN